MSYPITLLIVLLKSLDSPDFMFDPFCFHLFFFLSPPQVYKEGILQLSVDFILLLEESRCIALDSLIIMALLMHGGDLCIYVIYVFASLYIMEFLEKAFDHVVMVLSTFGDFGCKLVF